MNRRQLLVLAATLSSGPLLTACGAGSDAVPEERADGSGGPSGGPAQPEQWTADGEQLFVDLKTRAGRVVQQLATWDGQPDDGPLGALPPSARGRSLAAARPLQPPAAWSRASVEFVQLGGLVPVSVRATYASCLVLLRQDLPLSDGSPRRVRRTVDVRLRRPENEWVLDELAGAGGDPVPRPRSLSEPALRVLGDPRIGIADSARWDVHEGAVDPRLLDLMAALGQRTPYEVSVLRNGHPHEVIDGRKDAPVSNHSLGRALDVHAVDGTLVESLGGDRLQAFLRQVREEGVRLGLQLELGVPPGHDPDGPGGSTFANEVHVDHVHVALAR